MYKTLKLEEIPDLMNKGYFYQLTYSRTLNQEIHYHGFYEIIIVISGQCKHFVNGIESILQENEVVILRPQDYHCFMGQSLNSNLLSISLTEEEINKFYMLYGEKMRDLIYNGENPLSFKLDLIRQFMINKIYSKIIIGSEVVLILKALISDIFNFLIENYVIHEIPEKNIPLKFSDAVNSMKNVDYIVEGLPALIRLSCYSHTQLCRLMKKYYDISPKEYIFKLRMEYAYNMIKHSDLDFETIAEKIGYNSYSHFITSFTNKYGVSPSKLRKNL